MATAYQFGAVAGQPNDCLPDRMTNPGCRVDVMSRKQSFPDGTIGRSFIPCINNAQDLAQTLLAL